MRVKLAGHTLGRALADEDDLSCGDAATLIRVLENRVNTTQAKK